MSPVTLIFVTLATAFACASVGGGLYEFLVVDPSWPQRPDIVQPQRGGISRKRFWIPMHTVFELTLITALVLAWKAPAVRLGVLVALASHAAMRLWSAFDFIPKALAFERGEPGAIDAAAARSWRRRSKLRLPLDLVVCGGLLNALVAAARLGG